MHSSDSTRNAVLVQEHAALEGGGGRGCRTSEAEIEEQSSANSCVLRRHKWISLGSSRFYISKRQSWGVGLCVLCSKKSSFPLN